MIEVKVKLNVGEMKVEAARTLAVSSKPYVDVRFIVKGFFIIFSLFSNLFFIYRLNDVGIEGTFQGSVLCWWFILFFFFYFSFYSVRWFLILQTFLLVFLLYIFYLSSIAEWTLFFDHLGLQFKKLIWSNEELSLIYNKKVFFHFAEFKDNFFRLEEREKIIGNSKNPEDLHFVMRKRYADLKYVRQIDYFSLFVLALTGMVVFSYSLNYFLLDYTYFYMLYSGQFFTNLTYLDVLTHMSVTFFKFLQAYSF